MRPSLTRLLTGCLVLVILQVKSASSAAEVEVYGRLGGEVDLKQDVVPETATINSILWKVQGNLAMDWKGEEQRGFRQFKERGHLNNLTGAMTITGLIQSDSGLYSPEINNKDGTPVRLHVISDVPVPTLESCDNAVGTCTLVCEGDVTGAGQVIYTWSADGDVLSNVSGNEYIIQDSSDIREIKEFSCNLSNIFSWGSSNPISNPFTTTESEYKPNISVGVTVFIGLLLSILLLVLFHKWKTGEFFYEKASMPWEADFWKRNERPPRDADSNGTPRSQTQDLKDEEAPMT